MSDPEIEREIREASNRVRLLMGSIHAAYVMGEADYVDWLRRMTSVLWAKNLARPEKLRHLRALIDEVPDGLWPTLEQDAELRRHAKARRRQLATGGGRSGRPRKGKEISDDDLRNEVEQLLSQYPTKKECYELVAKRFGIPHGETVRGRLRRAARRQR